MNYRRCHLSEVTSCATRREGDNNNTSSRIAFLYIYTTSSHNKTLIAERTIWWSLNTHCCVSAFGWQKGGTGCSGGCGFLSYDGGFWWGCGNHPHQWGCHCCSPHQELAVFWRSAQDIPRVSTITRITELKVILTRGNGFLLQMAR